MSVKIRPNWNFESQDEANQLLLQLALENRAYLEAILQNLAFLTAKSTDTDVEELMMTLWQQVKDTGSQKFQELQQDYHANKVSSQEDEES
tara:strand:- start:361 stop:633 length:273 start_codon:yes stop_codon:yes gene_type:complete